MWNFLERACEKWDDWEMWDRGEFQQPFYAVLKSKPAGARTVMDAIENHNPERYFLNGDETDADGNRGMGFPKRTLDLVRIWSYRSFINSKNPVVGNTYTMRDIEERFVNHSKKTDKAYGMINSPACISPWASAFAQAASQKKFEWSEEGEWVQVG